MMKKPIAELEARRLALQEELDAGEGYCCAESDGTVRDAGRTWL